MPQPPVTGSVRPLKPARRGLTGKVVLAGQKLAGHESSLERDWLMALDFDWRVTHLQEQPYSLTYTLEGQSRRYTPDILATFKEGSREWTVVYEVKANEDLRANWALYRPRYKAAVHDCRQKDWRFRIVTERHIRTPYVNNVRFLRRYRDIPIQALHREAMLYTLCALGPTSPQALLAATWYDAEKQMVALCELWRLVALGEVAATLSEPLTMNSLIWLP
jgi:hypothetical protein